MRTLMASTWTTVAPACATWTATTFGEIMVRQGLVRDCPRLSERRYAKAEHQAAVDGATIQQEYRLPGYCNRL
jgi:hypothetical protein